MIASASWSQGALTNVTATPTSSAAGAGTTYTISFTAPSGVPANGRILLTFPAGFVVSGAAVAGNVSNLNGGFSVSVVGQVVMVTRDGTGAALPTNGTGSFNLSIIFNHTSVNAYTIAVETRNNAGTLLDSGTSAPFNITAGALDHFNLSAISNPTAGVSFSFTITGKDANNNNTAFNGTVNLSDPTGTLTPTSVPMNGTSVTVNNAKITKAQSNVAITASGGGKTGNSNSFTVLPGALAKFSLSNISSPQQAGTAFPVTITAQDNFNNTVTSFTGTVDISVNSGTLQPIISGNFSSGMRTENMVFLTTGSGKTVTVNDGSNHTGTSNSVTVNPGVPSGAVVLSAVPPAVPINSGTTVQISSSVIRDASNNPVGAGKIFNLSVNNSAFGSIVEGAQATTNSSSRLNLNFVAGATGGLATVVASSVDGAATGSVNISVNELKIFSVTAAPDSVSRDQDNIPVNMTVQNVGSDTITVNNAGLTFTRSGLDVSGDYTVTTPSFPIKIPGNSSLATLSFAVRVKSNARLGLIIIDGNLAGTLPGGTAISDSGAITTDSWRVQTPAKLSVALRVSQATVTRDQTQPWQVIMTVTNTGESKARIILANDSTGISLTGMPGYVVAPPSGNFIIPGNGFRDLVFAITQTGSTPGPVTITGQAFAREMNSNVLRFDDTSDGGSADIVVQTLARVSIDTLLLAQVFNFDSASNTATVNTGQNFQLKVKVRKTGEEKVDSVWVSLVSSDGSAVIGKNVVAISDSSPTADFAVTASTTPNASFLTAKIDSARSANTHANSVAIGTPGTKSVQLVAQNPADLRVAAVTLSEDTVRFARTQPWYISVRIRNLGQAPFVFDSDSSRVTVKVGGVPQNDYTIIDSTDNFGITLGPGEQDTLIYKVIKTGTSGGVATLTATVKGRDKNSNEMRAASRSATIFVETTALVRISKTSFPATVNRLTGTDIALVNTGQNFQLEVTVENTGGLETVDTVWVTLTGEQSGATIFAQQAKTQRRLGTQSDTAKALFSIAALSSPDSIGLKFTARIDSAKTLASYAGIGPALDDTALVRVEQPARLQLAVSTDDVDNSLSASQPFKVRALVSNAGRAQADNSGRLRIQVPEGYTLNDNAQKSFLVGVVQEWEVQAPNNNSVQDTFAVEMTRRPVDKNSGLPADAVNTLATVVVNTFVTGLSIDSVVVQSPNGAKDREISTDQIFTIAAHIKASDNLSTKTATLRMPAGFGYVLRSDSTKAIANGVVTWEVQAPRDEHLTAANFLLEASAFDGPTKLIKRDALIIERAERRAIVQLQPGISEPPGARGGILSTGQSLTISATLRNTGRATTRGEARVRLDLGNTGIITAEPLEKEVTIDSGSYEGTVLWHATAPDTVTTTPSLTFAITQPPLDVNTDAAVTTTNDPALFTVTTILAGSISAGNLRITAPAGATDDTLSTGQDFIVSTTADWTSAVNVSARLLLPSGFLTDDEVKSLNGYGETARDVPIFWRVQAPGQPVAKDSLWVRLEATDAHNNQLSLKDTSQALLVDVVDRAELELQAFISNPQSATRGVVSPGQPFEISAVITNLGNAAVYDTAKVRLDLSTAPGYALVDPQEPLTKAAVGGGFTWWVRARPTISNQNDIIRVEFVVRPRDENTDEPAFSSDRRSEFPVRVEGRRLLVRTLPRGTRPPTIQGQQGFPLLRLELSNPAGAGASNLVLKKLRFVLRDRNEQPVASNAALTAIRIVDDAQRGRLYGQLDLMPPENSIEVILPDSVVISTTKADTIALLGDVAASAAAANFYLAFDHGQDFTVVDQDSGSFVVIEDENGKTGEDFQINSEVTVLIDTNSDKAFGNYPNPFRPGNARNDGTFFLYHLPEDSDGELKIYSLLGELVWQTSFAANSPAGRAGFHNDDLFWDGFNGQGKKVLNGVYVAMLMTKNGKFITKVAVVK